MKRAGDLFEWIIAFDNLLSAAQAAYRGKRRKRRAAEFHFHLEYHLIGLQDTLARGVYRPGPYRSFWIRDPKPRLISAAPFRDRVVHHAVCRVIEPVFERGFIFDSYANRRGKGTHAALDRAFQFCRQARYVLKCDVAKFFPSIDHAILLELIARRIKCRPTLELLERIVSASNPQEPVTHYFRGDDLFTPTERRRGLPIGNLTSQILANVMLDPLDHYVKEELRCRRYVRFADDVLIFANAKSFLHATLSRLRRFLAGYRLKLHDRKCVVLPVRSGVPFLGWRLFPDRRRVRRSTGLRFQRRLQKLSQVFARGEITFDELRPSLASWLGHLKHGDTEGLRRRLLRETVFCRSRITQD